MKGEIKKKIHFLEMVSKGEGELNRYFCNLKSSEEKIKFFQLVNWAQKSKCITGLNNSSDDIICNDPKLTHIGQEVYDGRKDLLL